MDYPTQATMKGYVDRSRLKGLYKAQHNETSSFHLLVGEMTITLDDVPCLLHLPIMGSFLDHTYTTYTRKETKVY